MKKPMLIVLALLAGVCTWYILRAKNAAQAEAELWSEALDPAF